MAAVRTITPQAARRLFLTRQHLSGPPPTPDRERIMDTIRHLGCLQLDPIRAVAVVAGRTGNEKLWDLSERWFPEWTPRERLSDREITRRAAQRSLRALGVATTRHIRDHFTANRYPALPQVLEQLERERAI